MHGRQLAEADLYLGAARGVRQVRPVTLAGRSPHTCVKVTGHLQALAFLGLQLELQQALSTRLLVRRHSPLCVGQGGSGGPRKVFSFQCHPKSSSRGMVTSDQ